MRSCVVTREQKNFKHKRSHCGNLANRKSKNNKKSVVLKHRMS